MKNIVLLVILVGTLAFSSWWHTEVGEDELIDMGLYITNAESYANKIYTEENPKVLTLQDMLERSKTIEANFVIKDDWECAHSITCRLRCQRALILEDGGKYYTSNFIIVANPNCEDAKMFEYITNSSIDRIEEQL